MKGLSVYCMKGLSVYYMTALSVYHMKALSVKLLTNVNTTVVMLASTITDKPFRKCEDNIADMDCL